MNGTNPATPAHPIHDLLIARWSPYAFADRSVDVADLRSLFEAARWAPSSYNEQPWHYIVARREDPEQFAQLLSCLVEPNQAWAQAAPVLVLTVAGLNFARNGKPNGKAEHDIGLASAQLTVEATNRGLVVHQMGGILPDRAREVFGIPAGYEAVTGLAVGYAADPATLPDDVREREAKPRTRRPLQDFVFAGRWGETSAIVIP